MRSVIRERCYYCNRLLTRKNKSVDHLVPLSRGGTDGPANMVNACKDCNRDKGCLSVNEFRAVMAYRMGALVRIRFKFPGEIRKKEARRCRGG